MQNIAHKFTIQPNWIILKNVNIELIKTLK